MGVVVHRHAHIVTSLVLDVVRARLDLAEVQGVLPGAHAAVRVLQKVLVALLHCIHLDLAFVLHLDLGDGVASPG